MAESSSTPGRDPMEDLSASMAGMAGPSGTKGKAPERPMATPTPQQPPPPPTKVGVGVRTPILGRGIKIYRFSIEKLTEENARCWFRIVERQLRSQSSWEAIEHYMDVGHETFSSVIRSNRDWYMLDMKASMIIEHGLLPHTVLGMRGYSTAGSKWEQLRREFLSASSTEKAMRLSAMANWTWDPSAMSADQALDEFRRMMNEFIEVNGGVMVDISDLALIWYLQGLGDKYATLRMMVMSSTESLTWDYVISRVRDCMLVEKYMEKASRVQRAEKGPRCYNCERRGHIARECPNRKKDDSSSNEDRKKKPRKSKKGDRSRSKKGSKHKG